MESKNLIYKYGHFYDQATKERIELKDEAGVHMIAAPGSFIPASPVGMPADKKSNSAGKELKELADLSMASYSEIYKKGSFLYFSFHRQEGEINVFHEFQIELLDDLYLYLKREWKQQEEKLFDCSCVVKKNTTGTISHFEEIHAKSLNEAYKNTFVHFWGNKGNPACNALDRFYDEPGNEKKVISRLRKSSQDDNLK